MHGRYTRIHKSQIKACNRCGAQICFVQNRNGKWFPVNVVYPGEGEHRYPAYKHSAGAYNNMIPWHTCLPQRDHEGERMVNQAAKCALRVAFAARDLYRADPNADQSRLEAVQIRMQARIQRRMDALPEASRAYVR